jgi:hypothetical protein
MKQNYQTYGTRYADLGNGTKSIKFLLSKASKDMHEPLVPMFSLYLAHTSATQNFSIPTHLEGNMRPNGTSGGRFGQ